MANIEDIQPQSTEAKIVDLSARILETVKSILDAGEFDAFEGALDAGQVAKQVGSDRFQAALLFHEGGNLQPLAFARGLAAAAQKAGAAIHGNTPVIAIARGGSGWRLATAQGDVRARAVLLATNASRSGLWPGLDTAWYPVASSLGATPPVAPEIRARMLPHGQSFAELGSSFFFFFDHLNIIWKFCIWWHYSYLDSYNA